MVEDCARVDEKTKKRHGRDLLDWSHLEAFRAIAPVRAQAPHDYLTQGTYQLLAHAGEVGWHPEFAALMRATRKRKKAS
jgi:hypothetical protein